MNAVGSHKSKYEQNEMFYKKWSVGNCRINIKLIIFAVKVYGIYIIIDFQIFVRAL